MEITLSNMSIADLSIISSCGRLVRAFFFGMLHGVCRVHGRNIATSPKFNTEPENDGSNRNLVFQGLIFRCYVKLQGCILDHVQFLNLFAN